MDLQRTIPRLALLALTAGLAVAVPARADDAQAAGTGTTLDHVSLDACVCQRTAAGLCRRWTQPTVSWQLYAPGAATGTGGGLSNDDVERVLLASFADWQAIQCGVCSVPGALPPPTTLTNLPGEATAGVKAEVTGPSPGPGCIGVTCDKNPLGLSFAYGGLAKYSLLSSSCGPTGAMCDGGAANTSQVAYLRTDDEWPLGKLQVTATYLTTTKAGAIVDADILLRDTTHVFCVGQCPVSQYPIKDALNHEMAHALGLGSQNDVVALQAADLHAASDLVPYIPPETATCACLAYRFSTDASLCVQPETPLSCDAGPLRPMPGDASGHVRGLWAGALLACMTLLVVARRLRASRPS